MDSSETPVEIITQHLPGSTVTLHKWTVIKGIQTTRMFCNVGKYSHLKRNVSYHKTVTDSWHFKLRRTKKSVTLQIHTGVGYRLVVVAIIFEENVETKALATEVNPNLYYAEFPAERVEGYENVFLKKFGILRIRCECETELSENIPTIPIDTCRNHADGKCLFDNMICLYLTLPFCDFKLASTVNGKKVFRLHKSLLAARSIFFKEIFEDDTVSHEYFEVNTYSDVLRTVIRYLYTGQLPTLSFITLIEVLQVSKLLQFGCLQKKCLRLLREECIDEELMQIL